MRHAYSFKGTDNIISPALIYYRNLIYDNIQKAVQAARGAEHLWPHIKSHKMADVIRMSIDCGITRFKCATIAEAEVAASCGSTHIVLAYPLVGPNISRFIQLVTAFPQTHFYAIGDDIEMLTLLGKTARASAISVNILADVNLGMNRTGISLTELLSFCKSCTKIPGLTLRGMHCYDGHRTEHSYSDRKEQVDKIDKTLKTLFRTVKAEIPSCSIIILGGTPSFPCHVGFPEAFFSPGTLFIYDYGYLKNFPDLPYTPAAAILTRVISHPDNGVFTLDLGYKGIAADPAGIRGFLIGISNYEELFQSEEHWVFRMKPGYEQDCPEIGEELFVIPTHICPTSALYPYAVAVDNGEIVGQWPVSARNRKITF